MDLSRRTIAELPQATRSFIPNPVGKLIWSDISGIDLLDFDVFVTLKSGWNDASREGRKLVVSKTSLVQVLGVSSPNNLKGMLTNNRS
jgi:hypothetical protein